MIAARLLSVAAVTLAACQTLPNHEVSQTTLDQISRCGGGLNVRIDHGLAFRVGQDVELHGQVSASVGRTVQAAIFRQIDGTRADQLSYYRVYTDCVKGQEQLDGVIAEVKQKWDSLHHVLLTHSIPSSETSQLEELHRRELEELSNYRLLDARKTRKEIIIKLVRLDMSFEANPAYASANLPNFGLHGLFGPFNGTRRRGPAPSVSLCESYGATRDECRGR